MARLLFERFDADGSDAIDADELRALSASLGRELTDAQAAETLARLDVDHSGAVSLDEFMLWFAEGLSATRAESALEAYKAAAAAQALPPLASAQSPLVKVPRSLSKRRGSGFLGFDEGSVACRREGPGRETRRCGVARRSVARPVGASRAAAASVAAAAAAAASSSSAAAAASDPAAVSVEAGRSCSRGSSALPQAPSLPPTGGPGAA